MKSIVNTEIQDLPRHYKLALGVDTRGFEIYLKMMIIKRTADHWNKFKVARDIHLNKLDWYYEVRFTFHSDAGREVFKFDLSTEKGREESFQWHRKMTDSEKQPFPYILRNSHEPWFLDLFRRDYKEIFKEMYLDEDEYLKVLRSAKRANENSQKIYTYRQKKVIEKAASYFRTTMYNLDVYQKSDALEEAGLTEDRGYCYEEELLVEVVSNSRIEKLIDMIPPEENEKSKRFILSLIHI